MRELWGQKAGTPGLPWGCGWVFIKISAANEHGSLQISLTHPHPLHSSPSDWPRSGSYSPSLTQVPVLLAFTQEAQTAVVGHSHSWGRTACRGGVRGVGKAHQSNCGAFAFICPGCSPVPFWEQRPYPVLLKNYPISPWSSGPVNPRMPPVLDRNVFSCK